MSYVELRTLTKRYPGGVVAVDGISLSINKGEFVTLVGPSGCGKTTTLRTIAGFEDPTEGTVHVDGEDISRLPPDDRSTGTVFQNFALFPHLTVRENVAYGLTVRGVDNDEVDRRVDELLDLVDLHGIGDRVPGQLSGGQRQRVALARTLAPEPDVFLLDEPLSSLDKKLRESMQIELRRIHRELDITTLLVTHNQREALSMSDRIAVMRDGRIEMVGTPSEVYGSPRSRFVADFIGTANLFDGTVTVNEPDTPTFRNDHGIRIELPQCDGPEMPRSGSDREVTAIIRPEDVTLHAASGSEDCDLTGTVEFSRYLGSRFEYHIRTPEGVTIIATDSANGSTLAEQDAVSVEIPAEDVVVVEE